jgi:hypothetical protein
VYSHIDFGWHPSNSRGKAAQAGMWNGCDFCHSEVAIDISPGHRSLRDDALTATGHTVKPLVLNNLMAMIKYCMTFSKAIFERKPFVIEPDEIFLNDLFGSFVCRPIKPLAAAAQTITKEGVVRDI